MRAAFHTLGCKLNYAETSTFMKQFRERGFAVTDNIDKPAEVCVINTCTVTEKADRECRQVIRRALRHSPNAFVIVVGCYAQLAPEEIASIEGVDLILGSSEKFSMFNYVDKQFQKLKTPKIFTSPIDEINGFGPAYSSDGDRRTRSFLKIQDGCDYNCSFCTIPLARGASRSQPIEETVKQARWLVSQDYKEIVLTGVNVGDYGKKINLSLLTLVKELVKIDGLYRLRISSIEPNLLSDELIDFWAGSSVLVPHFHIPLQSGSDTVLRKMRRRYTTRDYKNLIEKIKQKLPDAGIGVDVIVGFPGETDELFEETYTFLVELPVSYLHVFSYSERENTPAASFSQRVSPDERSRRTRMLRILSSKQRRAFMENFIGNNVEVLFEESSKNGYINGLTPEYMRVTVPYTNDLINQFAVVHISGINGDTARGSVVRQTNSITVINDRKPEMLHLPVIQN